MSVRSRISLRHSVLFGKQFHEATRSCLGNLSPSTLNNLFFVNFLDSFQPKFWNPVVFQVDGFLYNLTCWVFHSLWVKIISGHCEWIYLCMKILHEWHSLVYGGMCALLWQWKRVIGFQITIKRIHLGQTRPDPNMTVVSIKCIR